MKPIVPYLGFGGDCREAMHFYQACLGGELMFQTIGESPMAEHMPEKMKTHILHAQLKNGELTLMASDLTHEPALNRGNSVGMVLNFTDEEKVRATYAKLVEGGKVLMELQKTFWSPLFGDLQDKYGNYWTLNLEGETENSTQS